MKYFVRVLAYIRPQYKALLVSIFSALLVAVLFSMSIAAMLPLMKVMIGEEGLHGWVDRNIVEHRTGIGFFVRDVSEAFSRSSETENNVPLTISSIKASSPAADAGLHSGLIIISIKNSAPGTEEITAHDKIMQTLAQAPGEPRFELKVKNIDEQPQTISIKLENPPIYAPLTNWLLGFIPRARGPEFKRNSIILVIILILIATIMRCTLRFIQEYLIRRIAFRSIMELRINAYKKAVRMPLSFFSQEGSSDTMSRFVQDSNQIQSGITTLFGKTIREPLKIISLGVIAFKIDAQMTAIVLMGAPVAAVVIGKLGKKMKRATRRTLESWSRMLGHLQETFIGIRIVKGYHREAYEENRFSQINRKLLRQQCRMAKIDAAGGPILESLGIVAACAGMIFAAYWLFDKQSRMNVSDFFILVALLGTMAESGRKLGNVIPRLQTANASAERVYRLVDAPVEADPPNARELPRLSRHLKIEHVTFRYPASSSPALEDINLTVKAGETVALVGPNGSGKTTLVSLIPRFFIPESGVIKIDDIDINTGSFKSLREQTGIVTQKCIVFNDTIAANIAYGDTNATQQDIVAAAKRAYAHEFITQTPDGYMTIIGEQGSTLSGGQLQRIAIARAILRDPAILIFDEAMSQIDTDSETKIQKTLAEFSRGRTSFIVAHRLSTIIDADRIVVMNRGRIVGLGTHQELLQSNTLYKQLYETQFVQGQAD